MRKKSIVAILFVLCLAAASVPRSFGQERKSSKHFEDAAEQSRKAARAFSEIMAAPDKGIPEDILNKAECVLVFPEVIKAGFIVGGRGGRGVGSCRVARGWSPPVYFDLGGGSFGFQIGAQATDFVLLFMNREGIDRLIGDKFEIGGDASIAAGPVGREAGASTNARMDAKILSYSRSRGLFAGLELKGVVIKPDHEDLDAVYGPGSSPKAILVEGRLTAPPEVLDFPHTLGKLSARAGYEARKQS